jgi:uncharacterized protein YcfJ|tara:strand:- start:30 stop:578 length:549 start_codon:yes stop_codon:yes gene_type:complete
MKTINSLLVTLLFATAGCTTMPLSAMANSSFTTQGQVNRIDPVYTNVSQNQPKQVCNNVEVPIYGRTGGGDAGGGALLGMILGGLGGKAVTGKDKGAAVGAVIGGIVGANNAQQGQRIVTGYRNERQCITQNSYHTVQVINEYDVTYNIDGRYISFRVNRAQGERLRIGQRKNFRIRYQMLN